MPGSSFIDTNVLVSVASNDAARATRAAEILLAGGTVSVQVLNELTNAARKKMRLGWAETNELLETIRRLVAVVPLTLETHERGLHVGDRFGLSVSDAMIVAAAIEAGADTLWAEDMQDGAVYEGVTVKNPFRAAGP